VHIPARAPARADRELQEAIDAREKAQQQLAREREELQGLRNAREAVRKAAACALPRQ
jgi:hypothetical protein